MFGMYQQHQVSPAAFCCPKFLFTMFLVKLMNHLSERSSSEYTGTNVLQIWMHITLSQDTVPSQQIDGN